MPGVLGVLLAGGRGRRLAAGGPKALAVLAGRTLLDRALDTLAAAADAIVVCAPAGMALPLPARTGGRPVRRADDPAGAPGPLAGMVAGMASGSFAAAVVLGVDLPLVPPAALRAMVARLAGRHAVVPVPGGFPQPLAAAYAPPAAAILAGRLAAGERAPTRALAALDVLRLDDAALAAWPGGAGAYLNLNTPADRAEAERRLAAGKATG